MMLALLPVMICATFVYSPRVLLIALVAIVTARITDLLAAYFRGSEVDVADKSSSVAALTFAMMLPVSIPLYMVVMDVALTIFVGKYAFGGRGVYPFNLAALAMCVRVVNWPLASCRVVTPFSEVDFWTGNARQAVSNVATIRSGGLPYTSVLNLILGNYPGSMGTSFRIIIVAVFIALLAMKKVTWHAPVAFVATVTLIALLFPRISGVDRLVSVKYEVLSSAVLYYRVFLLNEPTTTPKKKLGKLIFGVVCGALTMIFRYFGAYEIGGCFAILLANATEGMWDRLVPRMKSDDVTNIYRPSAPTARTAAKKEKGEDKSVRTAAVKTYDSTATSAETIIREIAREARRNERKKQERAKAAEKKIFTVDSAASAPQRPGREHVRKTTAVMPASEPETGEDTQVIRTTQNSATRQTVAPPESIERLSEQVKQEQAKEHKKASKKKKGLFSAFSSSKKKSSGKKDTKKKSNIFDNTTFDIIGQVEDEIDEVEFSTRTIDVAELLRALKEQEESDAWKK